MSQVTADHNQSQHLSLALRQTLSQTPSQVGMRLQSEEKLASELGIGRRQIREAINQHVINGYPTNLISHPFHPFPDIE